MSEWVDANEPRRRGKWKGPRAHGQPTWVLPNKCRGNDKTSFVRLAVSLSGFRADKRDRQERYSASRLQGIFGCKINDWSNRLHKSKQMRGDLDPDCKVIFGQTNLWSLHPGCTVIDSPAMQWSSVVWCTVYGGTSNDRG